MKAINLEALEAVETLIADLDGKCAEIKQLPIDVVPALQADVAELRRKLDLLQRLERASSSLRRIIDRLIIRGSVP